MASITDDIDLPKSGTTGHDEEDMDHGNDHALQLVTKEATGPQLSSIVHPSQLGSTHDPFCQFPVRWEESFGPLIHFCEYPF